MEDTTKLNRGTKRHCAAEPAKAPKLSKPTSIEASKEKNRLFRLFIEFVQNGRYECSLEESERLKDWISSAKIDVNQKDWTKRYEDTVYMMNWSSSNKKPVLLAFILKDLLPILFACNDDVNYTDEDGRTILHVFLEKYVNTVNFLSDDKRLKVPLIAKRLIEMGASVNLADNHGITPFHVAARKHHKELMDMILPIFTNVHSRDKDGNTILHYVIEKFVNDDRVPVNRYNSVVSTLLKKGADLHGKNKLGMTPLHVAAKYSHYEILNYFLRCGADINARTKDEDTPLLVLCKNLSIHDHDGMRCGAIELLLNSGCDANAKDKDGYSALHFIAKYHVDCVKMLVKRKVDVRCITKEFQLTPLHFANCPPTIRTLIVQGAEENVETTDGMTPLLYMTTMRRNLNTLKCLIDCGAKVEDRDKLFGFTALHFLALDYSKEKLEYLLDRGLDVNDGGKHGMTPLHLASLAGNLDAVRVLIQRGADVNCQEKNTRSTPLHFAKMKANCDAIDDVIKRVAAGKSKVPVRTSLKISRFWGQKHDEVIELLVKFGAKDSDDLLSLHQKNDRIPPKTVETLKKCDRSSMPTTPCSSAENHNQSSSKTPLANNSTQQLNEKSETVDRRAEVKKAMQALTKATSDYLGFDVGSMTIDEKLTFIMGSMHTTSQNMDQLRNQINDLYEKITNDAPE